MNVGAVQEGMCLCVCVKGCIRAIYEQKKHTYGIMVELKA